MNHSRYDTELVRTSRREQQGPTQASPRLSAQPRIVTSESLFMGDHEIGIEHHGALYRLKITRQGKLILNK